MRVAFVVFGSVLRFVSKLLDELASYQFGGLLLAGPVGLLSSR
jgi:hypothetical protein